MSSKRSRVSSLSKTRSTLKRVLLWIATVVLLVVFCAGGWVLLANADSRTYLAAQRGDLGTLRVLKSNDPSIDRAVRLTYSCKGWRPLIIAAAQGHADAVKILLEKGANPNVTNEKGRTALMFAAHYGYTNIVDQLLAAGAQPDLVPKDGPKAIVAAGMSGHAAPIISILKGGGTISASDCEPKYRDACVRIGMVLGGVLFHQERAKAINQPICDQGYQRSCAVVRAADCISRYTQSGVAPGIDQIWDLVKSCFPDAVSQCLMKAAENGIKLDHDSIMTCIQIEVPPAHVPETHAR